MILDEYNLFIILNINFINWNHQQIGQLFKETEIL